MRFKTKVKTITRIKAAVCTILSSFFFLTLVLLCIPQLSQAQNQNDCDGAEVICSDGPVSHTPLGPGNTDFNLTICGTHENQSAWYYIEFRDDMPPNSDLIFTISPLSGTTDWDFAMWGPDVPCDQLDAAGMVRCNYSHIGTTGLAFTPSAAFEPHLVVQPGEGYYLMVDNFSSNSTGFNINWGGSAAPYLNCDLDCELEAVAGDDIQICDGEEFTLNGSAVGGSGLETYHWTANPESIIQYITDTSLASSSVNIPIGIAQNVTFYLRVVDTNCIRIDSLELTIEPRIEPLFAIQEIVCSNDPVIDLPTTSIDGIDGSWMPEQIDPSTGAGTISIVFTPLAGQCADSTTLSVEIFDTQIPEFSLPDTLCENDPILVLPIVSDNGIPGIWTPADYVDPSNSGPGSINLTFRPNDDQFCAETINIFIEIDAAELPEFDFDPNLCEVSDPITLPTTSLNGYTGSWSIPILDPANAPSGSIISIFTPDDIATNCIAELSFEWIVSPEETPYFTPFDELCVVDDIFILPTQTSDGALSGAWSPSSIDPGDGIGSYPIVFRPDSQLHGCAAEYTTSIEVIETTMPIFNDITLCELDDLFVLPNVSINDISGTWSPEFIIPANSSSNTITANFTPDAQLCASPVSITINIEAAMIPEFSLPLTLCETNDQLLLPTTSDNGLIGTWSIPTVNPNGMGGQNFSAIFTPNTLMHPCSREIPILIYIEEASIPSFSLPNTICIASNPISLATISNNGVVGSWTTANLDPNNAVNGQIFSEFIPADGICAEHLSVSIPVQNLPEITSIIAANPSDCGMGDGTILVESNDPNSLFSIDNGTTWVMNGTFPNLSSGNYTILCRIANLDDCVLSIDTTLLSPGAPIIHETQVIHATDCDSFDGQISIQATGTQLEYSIDSGLTWQRDSIFNDLIPANYEIMVREIFSPNCITSDLAIILEPEPVKIDSVIVTDETECGQGNGELIIISQNSDIEYSIDGGITWSTNPNHYLLNPAVYSIFIRRIDHPNCMDEIEAIVHSAEPVFIDNLQTNDLSDCLIEDGQIEVETNSSDVEFSIDNGINWQTNPHFLNLGAGNYTILMRRIGTTHCTDELSIQLNAPFIPELNEINISQITECGLANGGVEIIATGDHLEYSIDGGITWQSHGNFEHLESGSYEIVIRSELYTDCTTSGSFEIEALIPPTLVLDSITHDLDCGENSGELFLEASGNNLEYSLDGINWIESSHFSELISGSYTAFVRDALNPSCYDEIDLIINGNNTPEFIEVIITNPSKCNEHDGRISIIASGENLEYSVDSISWQTNGKFENIGAGTYQIYVRNSEYINCANRQLIIVEEPPCPCDIEFYADVQNISCYGEQTGQVSLSTIDELMNSSILWNTGDETFELNELSAGIYSYEINYNDNCIIYDSIEIKQPQPISFELSTISSTCELATNGSISIDTATGGSGILSFVLNENTIEEMGTFNGLMSGNYEITAIDENNCRLSMSASVAHESAPELTITGNHIYTRGENIYLEANYGILNQDSIRWVLDNGLIIYSNPLELIATADLSGVFQLFYHECYEEQSFQIQVLPPKIYFPNAFSPNGDGINDIFYAYADLEMGSITYDLEIFNRWGGKVFSRQGININNQDAGWTGQQNTRDSQNGIYIYHATIYLDESKPLFQTGEIMLVD